jgi:hypothetical protein
MRQLMSRLWKDDCGAMLAVEWVFVATILVIGSITGLVAVRQAIIEELEDFAEAVMSLSTSWHFHDGDDSDDEGGRRHRGHHGRHGHDEGGDDFNRNIGRYHHEHDD